MTSDPINAITVAVRTVEQHFSGDLNFHLPWFQRAYAWCEEHAVRLLHDILEAVRGPRGRYFLGHVMLARPDDSDSAAIIDGHQRSLTLTIIFALMRDRAPDQAAYARLDRLIRGRSDTNIRAQFRVTPQPAQAQCFAKYVQEADATGREPDSDVHDYLECERNFINNRSHLGRALDEHLETAEDWHALAEFLLTRCTLVVEVVEEEDEAWEMLSVEETTGLAFHSSERSKVALISAMPRDVQEDAAGKWDLWQARLGADGMTQLLRHIRALRHGRRSAKPIEQDLISLFRLNTSGATFIDEVLIPRARDYYTLRSDGSIDGSRKADVWQSITFLHWLGRELWVPAALAWLEHRGSDDEVATATFFARLDRLAWILQIAGRDPVEQERRFLRIANNLMEGERVGDIEDLVIEDRILNAAAENLLSRTFYEKGYSRLVLRRLSAIIGLDSGPIDGEAATVEHVLPRRPALHSGWHQTFRNRKITDDHANRLGNLTILSFIDNQEAGGRDFADKQRILAQSGFALSQEVARMSEWTAITINQRTRKLAATLLASWQLELPVR